MQSNQNRDLLLMRLDDGMPGVSKRIGQQLAEASAFCLVHQSHTSGVELQVFGLSNTSFNVHWDIEISQQQISAWNDHQEATEDGATGMALLLLLALTDYTVIERSRKGTGFDYWLGLKEGVYPFQNKARLEVSGILNGNTSDINSRIARKLRQTAPTDGTLPAYIVVVEFSRPESHVVKK